MSIALRYGGLELPVYDADAPVVNDLELPDLEEIETFTPTTALRAVKGNLRAAPTAPTPETLPELLHITDEELETVSKLCMSKVVEHTWGLLKDPKGTHNGLHTPLGSLVPKGYSLVAEVDIIKNAIPATLRNAPRIFLRGNLGHIAIHPGVAQYYWRPEGYYLWDIASRQFVVGTSSQDEGKPRSSRWLVDIEPRLRHA